MRINSIYCPVFGDIAIELTDIDQLFSGHGDVFIKTFKLTEKMFDRIREFKNERGGVLIVIKDVDNVLGLFTLSYAENNFLELGDLMKLERSFPRETYAVAMESACKFVVEREKSDGIYIYPNPHAISLEKMAGFREGCLYIRIVSLVLLNYVLLLPIEIYGGKVRKRRNLNGRKLIRKEVEVSSTRLTVFNLRILKRSRHTNAAKSGVWVGILYEFLPSEGYGDPFLVFGNNDFDLSKIGFEFCDNSA